MKKTLLKYLTISILSIVIILGLVYLGLGYYYKNSFGYGTRINGIYCTGHNVEEVNNLLASQYEYAGLKVSSENGSVSFSIPAENIGFSYDFGEALDIYLSRQNPWLWPRNFLSANNHTLNPVVHINEESLEEELNKHGILNYDEKPCVEIIYDEGVYSLSDNYIHRPKSKDMREAIRESIYNSEEELVLDEKFFEDLEYTEADLKTIDTYYDISNMLGAHITYQMGSDTEVIDEVVLTSFLLRDESGELVELETCSDEQSGDDARSESASDRFCFDEEAIKAWVDTLADKYDSVGKDRMFNATGGFQVLVQGGIYGNELDREKEYEYLINAVSQKLNEVHEPEYKQKAWHQGVDDIGTTYVEVNMTDQMMYYYVAGEKVIETPVVTGNLRTSSDTPDGTNYVYFKQRNRVLIGPDYQTPVKYWMAVKGHIGIHDATWRKEFGGDIYKTSGSHGCINTPMDAVSQLYDMVEVGTPVVMYYTETKS